jgi:hypothetical protein
MTQLFREGVWRGNGTLFPPAVRDPFVSTLQRGLITLDECSEIDSLIGRAFVEAAVPATDIGPADDLVVSLGQTAFHCVRQPCSRDAAMATTATAMSRPEAL